MSKLYPPEDKLIVEVGIKEQVTESGIVISIGKGEDSNPHDTLRGTVLHVGFDCRKKVQIGDEILFEKRHGMPCNVGGIQCNVIRYRDILGVLKDE